MSVFDCLLETEADSSSENMELASVDIQANIRGLFTDVTTTQVFENNESKNIEAVYTFPLPLEAVLLELTVELNGKKLKGTVLPKSHAEETYEEAIDEGNSPILLEQADSGLYTVNVGNLLPGERATVTFRYALLLKWQGDTLRLQLPTTIAPRYGDPLASGLNHHQVPEYTLKQDTIFSLSVSLFGEHTRATVQCPSHSISETELDGVRTVEIAETKPAMDRDFILQLQASGDAEPEVFQAVDQDKQHVALASFQPEHCALTPKPRCIKLVVDCSGSMAGDSIIQAKKALQEILSLLKPEDFFNLTVFGFDPRLLFAQPVPASPSNIKKASLFIENMDANMGGTEIRIPLITNYESSVPADLPSDVLLITDGDIWCYETIIDDARQSNHRVFSVGVGSSVSEPFVKEIAEVSSGACELVSPREDMAERIVRHFKRIDQARAEFVNIDWPGDVLHQTPEKIHSVFAGDTIHVFGWLKEESLRTSVLMTAEFTNDSSFTQKATIADHTHTGSQFHDDLVRVAAHQRLKDLDDQEAEDLAVKHQLVTEHTSCVMVIEREEKADSIPELRKVKQALAAGYGGTGSVEFQDIDYSMLGRPTACRRTPKYSPSSSSGPDHTSGLDSSPDYLDIPAFLRRENDEPEPYKGNNKRILPDELKELGNFINLEYDRLKSGKIYTSSIDEFIDPWFGYSIRKELHGLFENDTTETDIVIAFLTWLAQNEAKEIFSRHMKRLIRQANKELPQRESLVLAIDGIIKEKMKMSSSLYRVKKSLLQFVKPD